MSLVWRRPGVIFFLPISYFHASPAALTAKVHQMMGIHWKACCVLSEETLPAWICFKTNSYTLDKSTDDMSWNISPYSPWCSFTQKTAQVNSFKHFGEQQDLLCPRALIESVWSFVRKRQVYVVSGCPFMSGHALEWATVTLCERSLSLTQEFLKNSASSSLYLSLKGKRVFA